jgi:hypothetical protein
MATKHLHTNNLQNVTLICNQDNLDITVNDDCTWCFADPDGVFGDPPQLLPAGSYTKTDPPTTYGAYTPIKSGTVYFNAVRTGNCDPYGVTETGHTITVSG